MSLAQVIQYEGDHSTFVWKHPKTNFNSLSQLIVHENQEAILFVDGKALELYGPGRHTLELPQAPKVNQFLRSVTGGKNLFHTEVYFINKTVQMEIRWGTDSKVRFVDPALGVPLELGACGELHLQVEDSRKLLVKLVGTMNSLVWEDEKGSLAKSLQNCFRPIISTIVKSNLASSIREHSIDILQIDENLQLLSNKLKEKLEPELAEYGLQIPGFFVTNVVLPETDPNFRRLRELRAVELQKQSIEAQAVFAAAERKVALEKQITETEIARQQAERDVIRAQAKKAAGIAEAEVMHAKGYTERDVLQTEVQKAYAESLGKMEISGGAGGVTGDVVGLGVGLAAAGVIGSQVGSMFRTMTPGAEPEIGTRCAKCGKTMAAGMRFCPDCGEPVAAGGGQTRCPQCGNAAENGKFCPVCGYQFVTVCPKCGNQAPAGMKFCSNCGEKL